MNVLLKKCCSEDSFAKESSMSLKCLSNGRRRGFAQERCINHLTARWEQIHLACGLPKAARRRDTWRP